MSDRVFELEQRLAEAQSLHERMTNEWLSLDGCVYQKVNLPHQSAFGLRHLNARVRGRSRCRAVIVPAR